MNNKVLEKTYNELDQLCVLIRTLVTEGSYNNCIEPICAAMSDNPHSPQPHNLLGIVLEKMGDHVAAMKHFRAAWALDPTYSPASHNLNVFGTFCSYGKCAFDESDVLPATKNDIAIEYDKRGIGHVVRR